MRRLDGQTALVVGGGEALGRAVALALSARGVRIVVTGRDEKALGITVGEIVHAGGKARHVAGGRDDAHLALAFDRAVEVFGGVDLVVDADGIDVEYILSDLTARLAGPGRVMVVGPVAAAPGIALLLRNAVDEVSSKAITCNAIGADPAIDGVAEAAAELVVFLAGASGDGITAQTVSVGAALRKP